MAFGSVGTLGSALSSGNNQTSLTLTTSAAVEAGNLLVVIIATDNDQTTDGASTAVSGVTAGGLPMTRAIEYTNSLGSTQDGAAVGIWYQVRTTQLNSSSSVTASFTSGTLIDASAMSAWEFTIGANKSVAVAATATLSNDGANAGSLDATTPNVECLRIRAIASESSSTTALTKTAAFTAILTQAVSGAGTSATEMGIRGEYLISTGTGEASAPTGGAGAVDHASAYVAFVEVDSRFGWDRVAQNVTAAVGVWPMLLLATQATSFAAPAPVTSNSVSQFGWHQPLSKAVPVAQAIQGHATVPFNTPQVAPPAASPEGWQAPLSSAVPVARAVSTQPVVPFNTAPTPRGWEQPLSTAPRLAVVANAGGLTFVAQPFPVADNNVTAKAWYLPLSGAPQPPLAQPTQATSFATPQPATDNNVTIDKWQQPLSRAVAVAKTVPTQSFVPFNTAQTPSNAVTIDKWLQPLSKSVPVARAQQGHAVVPFNPPPPIPIALVYDASTPRVQVVYYQALFSPIVIPQAADNNVTSKAWHQPLSVAPAVARAQQGHATVPFNTAQVVSTPAAGWHQPLSRPTRIASAVPTQPLFVSGPFTAPQGWFQPLSVAVPVARAKQGHASVPFNTVQPVQVNLGWFQPLSVAAKTARAVHTTVSFVALPFPSYPLGWFRPLAGAPPVAKAKQGHSFVPFNTAQTPPAGIAGMAWHQPLGTVPRAVPHPRQSPFIGWTIFEPPPNPTTQTTRRPLYRHGNSYWKGVT